MKVSKTQSAENRQAIVDAAARLYRERGLAGVGLAEISREAGFTHGGFYGRFESKDALAAEACGQALDQGLARLRDSLERHGGDAARQVRRVEHALRGVLQRTGQRQADIEHDDQHGDAADGVDDEFRSDGQRVAAVDMAAEGEQADDDGEHGQRDAGSLVAIVQRRRLP